MKEKSLAEKIASYSALAASMLIANAQKADGQIVYHDIIPNDSLVGSWNVPAYSYYDLNNDSIYDVWFHGRKFSPDLASVFLNHNSIFNFKNTPFQYGEIINAGLNFNAFQNSALCYTSLSYTNNTWWYSWETGPWANAGVDKYLPFRIISGGQTNYGWMRLDVNTATNSLIVKDFAINMTPDSSIAAGDNGCPSVSQNIEITNLSDDTLQSSPAVSYQWYLNGNLISGATNQFYTPTVSGNYSVEGTNEFGCSAMSDEVYFQVDSVNPVDPQSGIQLLIDPKYLQIIFSNEKFVWAKMQLFNSTGQLVSEMRATKTTEQISIEQLPKGIYILSIRSNDEIRNYKVAIL